MVTNLDDVDAWCGILHHVDSRCIDRYSVFVFLFFLRKAYDVKIVQRRHYIK
jgi:hypothetical protein